MRVTSPHNRLLGEMSDGHPKSSEMLSAYELVAQVDLPALTRRTRVQMVVGVSEVYRSLFLGLERLVKLGPFELYSNDICDTGKAPVYY